MEKAGGYLPRFALRTGLLVAEIIDLSDCQDALISFLESKVRSVVFAVCRMQVCVEGPGSNLDRRCNRVRGLGTPLRSSWRPKEGCVVRTEREWVGIDPVIDIVCENRKGSK